MRQVGKDLNVRYVLEGSVQREGDQIRVTTQLIDAATDTHLWSERWDKPSKEFSRCRATSPASLAIVSARRG